MVCIYDFYLTINNSELYGSITGSILLTTGLKYINSIRN